LGGHFGILDSTQLEKMMLALLAGTLPGLRRFNPGYTMRPSPCHTKLADHGVELSTTERPLVFISQHGRLQPDIAYVSGRKPAEQLIRDALREHDDVAWPAALLRQGIYAIREPEHNRQDHDHQGESRPG
jgi:hypothetical protein